MGSKGTYRFSLRLTEDEYSQFEKVVTEFNKKHKVKISKNDMLIKLIKDKRNDEQTTNSKEK